MISEITLATHNAHKVEEMRQLLAPAGWNVLSAEGLPEPEETGITFEENALIKARAAAQKRGMWALADDSGLCVEALNGAPGVYTARYGGWPKLLANMAEIQTREASFICVLALVSPQGDAFLFRGECKGHIASDGRGSGTFGYDPVFVPLQDSRTFAEMTTEEKAAFSHRAIAVQSLLEWWSHARS